MACTYNYVPVCGTDGQTYGNDCELNAFNCMRRTQVAVAYAGECGQQMNECNVACQYNYEPVCGTDGQTYGNRCELESLSCMRRSGVAVAFQGECAPSAECNIACQVNYNPVCGSDGQTYGNICELESTACVRRNAVVFQHEGSCEVAQSECNIACTLNYVPVCGTDGQTYGNQCELESVACLKRSNVAVAYNGACEEPAVEACNIACQLNYLPVCGTDGQTYGNSCELESVACLQKSNLVVAYEGQCGASFVPEEVACNEACLRNWEPVCGTDGITYGNLCQMESFSCMKRLKLAVDHVGEC